MWSLYEGKKELKPLKFSNGKTQEDVVNEVVNEIRNGEKIIFIKGMCGTGKSAIALNIAKELGKTSIVVPIKTLQKQYEYDYMNKKTIYKDENQSEKLNISVISGRNNHPCLFLEENKEISKKETNSKLFDIFENKTDKNNFPIEKNADHPLIPCKIELKEKNKQKIFEFLSKNPNLSKNFENDIKKLNRMSVAPACPYWSPILPSHLKTNLDFKSKKTYISIDGEQTIYSRKSGCPYYEQFNSYADSDVVIFNSKQYLLETWLGRKPLTEVEIIDECDEFLDNFATEGRINLTLLNTELTYMKVEQDQRDLLFELKDLVFNVIEESDDVFKMEDTDFPLKKSKVYELVNFFINNDVFKITDDEDSYLFHCLENSRKFDGVIDDTFVRFSKGKEKKDIFIELVTINLKKIFQYLINKNKAFVMMSGTLHSEEVLKSIFGIENFKVIVAEDKSPGTINKIKTGFEADFKYDNLRSGRFTRIHYLKALNKCVEKSKRPTLVHVNSFSDLPTQEEQTKYSLNFLITQDVLKTSQKIDKTGEMIHDFKNGDIDILFTTKCNRGVDFPGETCNSVVITKYPYPDVHSLFWKILKTYTPELFWDFYKDKAKRELFQKVYRSVRFKDDKVDIYSPDLRVLDAEIK